MAIAEHVTDDELERAKTPDQLRLLGHWMGKREQKRVDAMTYAVYRAFAGDK